MSKRLWEDEDDTDVKSTLRSRAPQWVQKFEGIEYFELSLYST
jgi:hypothetical protein